MAQLLYERQSTKAHLNAVSRHIRLCRRASGTEEVIAAINPYYKALIEKQNASEEAKQKREMAYDDVIFNDDLLDDEVRTCYDDCKKHDRKNPGRPVLNIVFPDGKFSPIINAPLKDEPDEVEQLVIRIESLGAEHPLNQTIASLKEGINNCRNALKEYHNSISTQKSVEALEEIAQANLRRQYEYNYLDLIKLFGKKHANRFFPVLHNTSKNNVDDTTLETSEPKTGE